MSQNDLRSREFIGRGLNFPLRVDAQGRLALTNGQNEIEQSIQIILETAPGERVMRPEFGCRVWELLFAPRDAALEATLIEYVEEALHRWEPRIEIQDIIVLDQGHAEGAIFAEIQYMIKSTHDERSIVYPFYILNETPTPFNE